MAVDQLFGFRLPEFRNFKPNERNKYMEIAECGILFFYGGGSTVWLPASGIPEL